MKNTIKIFFMLLITMVFMPLFTITARADDVLLQHRWGDETYCMTSGHDAYSGWFAWNYYDNITVTVDTGGSDWVSVWFENSAGSALYTPFNNVERTNESRSFNPQSYASSGSVRMHVFIQNRGYTHLNITAHKNTHSHSYT